MGLQTYHEKRDFQRTTEPKGRLAKASQRRFVVHEHHASRLHYDFRMEIGGVLKSWAIPKGPSLNPRDKRLAVAVEDHPVAYIDYEGHIPEGNYGAGDVVIWDAGTYELLEEEDPLEAIDAGKLRFRLHGRKLQGDFTLIKMARRDKQWLLIKSNDEFADPNWQTQPTLGTPKAVVEGGKPNRAGKPASGARAAGKTGGRTKKSRPPARPGVGPRRTRAKTVEGPALTAQKVFQSGELKGDILVNVDNHSLRLTHLDKRYWPKEGYTKGDLLKYYFHIAGYILPYLQDRPLILKRYPNGIEGKFFFQHDVTDAPDFVRTVPLEVEGGRTVNYVVCDHLATLLYIVNFGTIAQHPWHSRVSQLDHPDWIIFDLDPQAADYRVVCEVAIAIKEHLADLGLKAYAKTSGASGMHVYVPIAPVYSYEQAADFAQQVAAWVARDNPNTATLERALRRRKGGHVYVDHLQNARGKTMAAPYSVRERAGATVSAPLDWKEVLRGVRLEDFTIETLPKRLAKTGDLFQAVLDNKQRLDDALAKLKKVTAKSRARRTAA